MGAPGVKKGSKGGQNCPFLIKSSQETGNLHFYVKSPEKSNGIVRFCRILEFDPFWGTQGSPGSFQGGNFAQNRNNRILSHVLLIVIDLNRCQIIINRL